MRTIRHITPHDVPTVMQIIEQARQKMRAGGNMHQWVDGYPSLEQINLDEQRNVGFVVEDNGKIEAYFACIKSPEPTYNVIYRGSWLDNKQPYYVIHRLASANGVKGIFKLVVDWTETFTQNLRVDTHRDNAVMQHLARKSGFSYCGIIYLVNGDERLAFQRIKQTK